MLNVDDVCYVASSGYDYVGGVWHERKWHWMNASHGQEMNVIKRKEELCVVAVDSEANTMASRKKEGKEVPLIKDE